MMHPDTALKTVSPEIGVGVFATRFIPKGTIVYVEDPLEITISPDSPAFEIAALRRLIEIYAIIKANGDYEISWDYAKYINHCCHYNILTTGFGFDIAVRDIQTGEQLRDDYGIFNVDYEMELFCDYEDCRKKVRKADFENYEAQWDRDAVDAMAHIQSVPQALWEVMDPQLRTLLETYLETGEGFVPIRMQRHEPPQLGSGDP